MVSTLSSFASCPTLPEQSPIRLQTLSRRHGPLSGRPDNQILVNQ
jgi:hypothetical protein